LADRRYGGFVVPWLSKKKRKPSQTRVPRGKLTGKRRICQCAKKAVQSEPTAAHKTGRWGDSLPKMGLCKGKTKLKKTMMHIQKRGRVKKLITFFLRVQKGNNRCPAEARDRSLPFTSKNRGKEGLPFKRKSVDGKKKSSFPTCGQTPI